MQLPSEWNRPFVDILSTYPDIRHAAAAAMRQYDIRLFDREIQLILTRLLAEPGINERLAEEADLFGNAHWYNYGAFCKESAPLDAPQFVDLVRHQFTQHCQAGRLAEAVGQLSETAWQHIATMHFVYLLFALYEKPRCQEEFGLPSDRRLRLRCSQNPLKRWLSRCI